MRWPRRHRPLCPPLDEHGKLADSGRFGLWHVAAYLPDGRESEVFGLLAAHGIEVYRAWPVRKDGETTAEASRRMRASMDEVERVPVLFTSELTRALDRFGEALRADTARLAEALAKVRA